MDLGQCLKGKVALITGSGRGIGKAVAEFAARSGAAVGCVDIDETAVRQLAQSVTEAGGSALALTADVRKLTDLIGAFDRLAARFGGVDTVLACAGIYPMATLDNVDDDHWDAVLNLNLKGVFYTVKAALPHLQNRGGGEIVVVSSITGNRVGYPGLTVYAASKAGINGFIKSAALELAPMKIRVNGVEPGTVRTPGVEAMGEAMLAKIASVIPLHRLASPAEIAGAAVFLASDAASYITGQTIIVDGGQTLPELPLSLS
jgi:3-oxoacyl-[acyl-carrier protein] reductase